MRLNKIEFPILVTFREKHGEWKALCKSKEGFLQLCVEVVNQRKPYGCYTTKLREKPVAPIKPAEDAPAYIQKAYETELKKYVSDSNCYGYEKQDFDLIQQIEAGDKEAAYTLLSLHEDGEYSGFTIDTISKMRTYE